MDLHVFPIPIPPPTSLSTPFLWVFPVHQARALVYIAFKTYLIAFLTTDSLPTWLSGKEPSCQVQDSQRHGFNPWAGKISQRRAGQPTPVVLLGESPGQRSLVGYSPQFGKESNTAEVT